MRRVALALLIAVVLIGIGEYSHHPTYQHVKASAREMVASPHLTIHFSPNGGCTNAIVEEINNAKQSVYIQAYSFTSQPIVQATINAFKKGLTVGVILDKSQLHGPGSIGNDLLTNHVPTWVDAKHAIAHNKIIIVDGNMVSTGSFNFSESAESRNAENLIQIPDIDIAILYKANWDLHKTHSDELTKSLLLSRRKKSKEAQPE